MSNLRKTPNSEQGFSLIELLLVVLILAIVLTLGLMGIFQARTSLQLSNSANTLQSYLEKAISDAKRRNAKGSARSVIQVLDANSYQVKIDLDGDGNVNTQVIKLPGQISFLYDPANPPKATIDWRGNIAEGEVTYILKSKDGKISKIKLTGKGDTSVNTEFPTIPAVNATPTSSDVKSSTVLIGNSAPTQEISPTPTPTPLPFCTGNQKPAVNNCRCSAGKIIDKDGNCKNS